MSKAFPVIAGLAAAGGLIYFVGQAAVPGSLRAEQQAQRTLQAITIEPATGVTVQQVQQDSEPEKKGRPEQIVVQRNAYLDAAIAAYSTESDNLICARAAYYQGVAQQKQTELGQNPEQYLLDLLAQQNQQILTTATQTGGFNGTADLQGKGRSLTLDGLAILKALQGMYAGEAKSCISEPYQAGENVNNYLIRAQQYRSNLAQEANKVIDPTKEAQANASQ
ncbi:MAG: hypothetical protein KME15_26400 [Drouetiella hepatica Uher 2000/2452]|jgi:hypothetical protein|uniref:Uncharacterized protein n=1 Tax=Drouetiella hepatica Uher 2000/2452 TaxID=904376 RepID=A0A951QHJ3_9CYAN|nr:hypothetical protein [Drouetiella hepatica Uher 2000/2452]